tara:strand:- start:549 stop:1433 length:885 start_codon:yes stop_codon:yes gene_type:complete
MVSWYKRNYNKRSAKKHGWDPSWFGASAFDEELIEKIKIFQETNNLTVDGLCGSMTYRRMYTSRQMFQIPDEEVDYSDNDKFIYCDGYKKKIKWDKVKTSWIKDGCYSKQAKYRTPTMIVTHWDAALSAASCKRILEKRKISTHFVIDNDGTILQLVDTNHVAWHAGIRSVNKASIGVDFSNAVYTKYNLTYQRRGHGLRPVIENCRVHGRKIKPFLGYYPVQLEAYKALLRALHEHYQIELKCPLDAEGNLLTTVDDTARKAKFKGVVNHYNLTKKKWDTSGLELDKILKEIT